jgi:hypothetical protein
MIEGAEETLALLHPFHELKRVRFPIDLINTRVPSILISRFYSWTR